MKVQLMIKKLTASDLGWFSECRKKGTTKSHQFGIHMPKNIINAVFPNALLRKKVFTVNTYHFNEKSVLVYDGNRPIKLQSGDWRLIGETIKDAFYGNLKPGDYMIMQLLKVKKEWQLTWDVAYSCKDRRRNELYDYLENKVRTTMLITEETIFEKVFSLLGKIIPQNIDIKTNVQMQLNTFDMVAKQETNSVENLPSAKSLLSLRSIGYSLEAAVADVVDNSISAEAENIAVDFWRKDTVCSLIIADDGKGMDKEKLYEAMRLGSESEYSENSLGKFGMGLKTASLSQCRKLTVTSRPKNIAEIYSFQWDINHVTRTNKWEMLEPSLQSIYQYPQSSLLKESSGTIVIWEEMEYLNQELASFSNISLHEKYWNKITERLKLHLRMTFHRFLDGSLDHKVQIFFNGSPLEPWDPFCRQEPNIRIMEKSEFQVAEARGSRVEIEPFVLPVKDGESGFSSIYAWEDAKGLLPWNDSQGYYIYRADRLIHFGGWLRTRAKDEHTKYARIAISFTPEMDEAFNISVNKAQIRLPASLFEYLKSTINPVVVEAAQKPYRSKPKQNPSAKHKKSQAVINKVANYVLPKRVVKVEAKNDGNAIVSNAHGTFIVKSNALNIGTDKQIQNLKNRFGVLTGKLDKSKLWDLVCKPDGGFAVILNSDHEFYKKAYQGNENNLPLVKFMDAILFAMAYAELFSSSQDNRWVFEEVRDTVSMILEEVARKHIS